tara:strand:- start:13223 stop:13975 length:753 start_codon:yes stop_codon:yes gene_type:complete
MRLISRIDLKGDKFVKSIQMEGLRNLGNPKLTAENYCKEGINELIISDCSASWFGQEILPNVIKDITENIFIPTLIGGGIQKLEDCEKLFHAGADKITINTGAINKPDIIDSIAKKYGSQSVSITIEYKFQNDEFNLYKCFGREKTPLKMSNWINEVVSRGAGELIFSCIDKDGTGKGFDKNILNLLENIRIDVPVIISGGFGKIEHLEFLKKYINLIQGVCISKSFHYNEIKIKKVKEYFNTIILSEKK